MAGFPTCDREALHQNVMGVMMATMGLSDPMCLMLMELVPERGSDLWNRFKAWQRARPDGSPSGFSDWVQKTVMDNYTTATYPKGCTLDKFTRKMLNQDVLKASGARTDNELFANYFGVEPFASRARQVSCKGCPQSSCENLIDPFSRGGRRGRGGRR